LASSVGCEWTTNRCSGQVQADTVGCASVASNFTQQVSEMFGLLLLLQALYRSMDGENQGQYRE